MGWQHHALPDPAIGSSGVGFPDTLPVLEECDAKILGWALEDLSTLT
jgi:hypothetical protein